MSYRGQVIGVQPCQYKRLLRIGAGLLVPANRVKSVAANSKFSSFCDGDEILRHHATTTAGVDKCQGRWSGS